MGGSALVAATGVGLLVYAVMNSQASDKEDDKNLLPDYKPIYPELPNQKPPAEERPPSKPPEKPSEKPEVPDIPSDNGNRPIKPDPGPPAVDPGPGTVEPRPPVAPPKPDDPPEEIPDVPGIPEQPLPEPPNLPPPSQEAQTPEEAAATLGLKESQVKKLTIVPAAALAFGLGYCTKGAWMMGIEPIGGESNWHPQGVGRRDPTKLWYLPKILNLDANPYSTSDLDELEDDYGDDFCPHMFCSWTDGVSRETTDNFFHTWCENANTGYAIHSLAVGGRVFSDLTIDRGTLGARLGVGFMGRELYILSNRPDVKGWVHMEANRILSDQSPAGCPKRFKGNFYNSPIFPASSSVISTHGKPSKNFLVETNSNRVLLYGVNVSDLVFLGAWTHFMTIPSSGYSVKDVVVDGFHFLEVICLKGKLAVHLKRQRKNLIVFS